MENIISINNLTKDYGKGRGVFDISLNIPKGSVYGYIGTNGSGKTTTIRQMMGFVKSDSGTATINGLDSWKNATDIKKYVSYVPGEIAFPSLATGTDFLKLQAEYLGIHDFKYMNHIIEMLQLDPTANLKRMSKGMKQKTALVAALMGEKEILVLDEPTTGLDPLMRDSFLELIKEEKEKGHTVFMSSHIFEEIEEVCDSVAMIKDGHLIDNIDLYQLRHWDTKTIDLQFKNSEDYKTFIKSWNIIENMNDSDFSCRIIIPAEDLNKLFKELTNYNLKTLRERHINLQEYFLDVYAKNK